MLIQGQLCTDEDDYVILIDSEQSQEEQDKTYWHELAHLVLLEYGIEKQDEDKIDSIAELLMKQTTEEKIK